MATKMKRLATKVQKALPPPRVTRIQHIENRAPPILGTNIKIPDEEIFQKRSMKKKSFTDEVHECLTLT